MDPRTHLGLDRRWSGAPVELREGHAVVELATLPEMAVDERGLVHGGFVFGAADHAAMLAVNDPYVVLASASLEFVRPVRVGETLRALAQVTGGEKLRRVVRCVVSGPAGDVLRADLVCVVLDHHVFDHRRGDRPAGRDPQGLAESRQP